MNNIFEYVIGAGSGGIIVVVAYLKILAARLDTLTEGVTDVGRKVDKLDATRYGCVSWSA